MSGTRLEGRETLPLSATLGRVLAQDLLSPADHPAFHNSAVDGYAFRFSVEPIARRIVGEVKAGDNPNWNLAADECVRIFTGARVPESADTIVMQEYTQVDGDLMLHHDQNLRQGGNIRRQGEQIRAGETAMKAGEKITPAAIGHLASLGIAEVVVSRLPVVNIIVTGSEFAGSASELSQGRIFESNSHMLVAALAGLKITASATQVFDDLALLTAQVARLMQGSDMLLITGGVSVGDYDFTKAALSANGYETVFHGVQQQPGKPLLMMRNGDKIAWGLPGNPRSVLVCFYMYVWPSLCHGLGASEPFLPSISLPLAQAFTKKQERAQLLTAVLTPEGALLDGQQNSNMLGSFAAARALVHLPAGQSSFPQATPVQVILLPT